MNERVIGKRWIAKLNATVRAQLGLSWDPLNADGGVDQIYVVGPDRKAVSDVERARNVVVVARGHAHQRPARVRGGRRDARRGAGLLRSDVRREDR